MRFAPAARILSAAAFVACTAAPALAGPPLVCMPYDIGTAHSLPWNTKANTWKGVRADYRLSTLTGDTLALLTPTTPTIVRMETLRRAGIYASSDPAVARALLTTLLDRAKAKGADPMAAFDAGFLVEIYKQLGPISRETGALAAGMDGYAMVEASRRARPSDPGIAFAAAMITLDGRRGDHQEHVRSARAGGAANVLLAKNLGHLDH